MSSRDKGARAPSQRQLKVGELVRHALAEIFSRGEVLDEVIERHSLTVPEVRMSPDLKVATCYVMPLGGGEATDVVKHLAKHQRFLRGEVAKRVDLRYMPELRFREDTSFEASSRIDQILASPEVARDTRNSARDLDE
jgi:ribosome-binding factor A